jgi:hypothetical protein
MTDSTAPASTDTENCSNCRHHTKQNHKQPRWRAEGVEEWNEDVTKPVILCMAPGPRLNNVMVEPIRCEVYSPGQKGVVTSELSQRMDAALERLKNTKDRER